MKIERGCSLARLIDMKQNRFRFCTDGKAQPLERRAVKLRLLLCTDRRWRGAYPYCLQHCEEVGWPGTGGLGHSVRELEHHKKLAVSKLAMEQFSVSDRK